MAEEHPHGEEPVDSQDPLLAKLIHAEELAEDILADKRQLVDLDKRRQSTRQALRSLQKQQKGTGHDKQWLCLGPTFMKMPTPRAQELLETDFRNLEQELTNLRKGLKDKVKVLRELENKKFDTGFQLNPLSKDELRAIDGLL